MKLFLYKIHNFLKSKIDKCSILMFNFTNSEYNKTEACQKAFTSVLLFIYFDSIKNFCYQNVSKNTFYFYSFMRNIYHFNNKDYQAMEPVYN